MMGMDDDVSGPQPCFDVTTSGLHRHAAGRMTAGGAHPSDKPVPLTGLACRLAELMEGAITSQTLARQYYRVAHRFLTAAREARHKLARSTYEAHLREARKAHEQARKCLRFACLCRQRAQCLADIGGFPFQPRW
jgi:hypothetical protein